MDPWLEMHRIVELAVKDTSDVNQGQASLKARYYANMDLDVFLSLVTSKKSSYWLKSGHHSPLTKH